MTRRCRSLLVTLTLLASAPVGDAGHAGVPSGEFLLVRHEGPVNGDLIHHASRHAQVIGPERHAVLVFGDRETQRILRGIAGIASVEPVPTWRKHAFGPRRTVWGRFIAIVHERAVGAFAAAVGVAPAMLRSGYAGTGLRRVHLSGPIDPSQLAKLPYVLRLEPSGPPTMLGERGAQIQAGNVGADGMPLHGYRAWLTRLDLDGSGASVAVIDTGIDDTHPSLTGRVTSRFGYSVTPGVLDPNGHGTHVAGIIAGDPPHGHNRDNAGFTYGLGIAPGASLVDVNFSKPPHGDAPTTGEMVREAWTRDARIVNASWSFYSDLKATPYAEVSREIDALARDADPSIPGAQEIALVFAAGNQFKSGPPKPQDAKNIITVGAVGSSWAGWDPETVADYSQWGPNLDGRIFPTVVAPGTSVDSARATIGAYATALCGVTVSAAPWYIICSGTSMAAPHAAGAVALIEQWWRRRTGASLSPALARAFLVNGARDIGPTDIPNPREGWGRVDLGATLADDPLVVHDQDEVFTETGQFHAQDIEIDDPSQPLKVTLAWNDAPGVPGAIAPLVNDLDLQVQRIEDGTVWRGNVFEDGASVPGGSPDLVNNTENVFIRAPVPGRYRITVTASDLLGDGIPGNGLDRDQDFALLIRNAIAA